MNRLETIRDFCMNADIPRIKTASRAGGCLCDARGLHSQEREHSVTKCQDAADDGQAGEEGDEGREADPQEEQPHAPTGNRFGKTDVHCEFSFGS